MATPRGSRPTFVAPSAERFPLQLPSRRQQVLVRIATIAYVLAWLVAGTLAALSGKVDPLSVVGLATWFIAGWVLYLASSRQETRVWYVFRVAWFGENVKRSRSLVADAEEAEMRALQARASGLYAPEDVVEVANRQREERARETGRWVADGMRPSDAPDATLVSIATDMPTAAEFTDREIVALKLATDAPANFRASAGDAPPTALRRAEVAPEADALLARGVLRGAGLGAEIASNWMPLLGVAMFAEQKLSASWTDGDRALGFTCLVAGDHLVVHEQEIAQGPGTASASPAPGPHRFRLATVEGVLDTVIAAGPALVERSPGGIEPSLSLTSRSRDGNDEVWTVYADAPDRFRLRIGGPDGLLVNGLDPTLLRQRLRPLLTG